MPIYFHPTRSSPFLPHTHSLTHTPTLSHLPHLSLGLRAPNRLKSAGQVSDSPFGHVGLGGSTAFCDPETNTSIAITVNRLQLDKEVAERITDAITDALQIGQFDLM